jgi:hypothetical protein
MFYLHSDNIDESTKFYRVLGFDVAVDRIDGIGGRHVRLRHDRTGHFLIALENRPELLKNFSKTISLDNHPLRTALTLVTEDYLYWVAQLELLGVTPVLEIVEPWGIWIYYRDPSDNLICISDESIW